ncbi:hypothetical protein ACIRBX_15335 [Kitasatospora sp. NPDC096147]|uniref:hypothetical protein n=1 Tax=Kitasatospora sp. NPDC096147 TaxID=3364093 RepID=UPI0037F22FCA
MITYECRSLRTLADEERWPELLGLYRESRAVGAALRGESQGAAETAPLGHLIAYGAPPELAARLFDPDGGPGTTATTADHDSGPLWEVLATRHTWRRLAPLLGPEPVRRLVRHTRILLGEQLGPAAEPDPEGVPPALEPWELAARQPDALVREYLPKGGARRALLTLPAGLEGLGPVELPERGEQVMGLAATRLLATTVPWVTARCVRGPGPAAAAQLTTARRVTGGHVSFGAVYPALLQAATERPWQGSAEGRLALWRLLAAMTGADTVSVPEVNALVARLRCFTWQEPDDELRFLHLALEDPATGLSWALSGARYDP